MNRNYMVIRSETGLDDTYTLRMVSGNKIPGLLEFQEKWLDGTPMFYYDITSKQPLNRLVERQKMTEAEIRTLISDLIFVLRQMERFLLDEQRICLKAECIYIDPETGHGSFCLVPGYQTDFTKAFFDFAQYILDHVNHGDGGAVVLAFSIFRESRKENFGVDDIERCLGKAMKHEERKEAPEQEPEMVLEEEMVCDHQFDVQVEQEDHEDKRRSPIALCVTIVGMVALPLCGGFIFGIRFLLRWKWLMLAFEMLLAAVGIVIYYYLKVEEDSGTESRKSNEFELGDYIWDLNEEIEQEPAAQPESHSEIEQENDMQTVLLISKADLIQKRKLVSLADRKEIPVDYFPFLIGKNKGLVDVCLNEPGVSRLHAKLEQEGTEYFITDLNSTNGTKINGLLLGANERKELRIGDELDFAGVLFRFQ